MGNELKDLSPHDLRHKIRQGELRGATAAYANGFIQANLVICEKDWAYDFLVFAQRNPKPCPVLEVGEIGSPLTQFLAKDADVSQDIPRYRIFRKGQFVEERDSIKDLWTKDMVYFLLGCSFSFENALLQSGLELRHHSENKNVPMYRTNIMCRGAGKFTDSPMVVSMRPFNKSQIDQVVEITRQYPGVHGAPIHIGDPSAIGIAELAKVDFGDAVQVKKDEVPVFWACGVTPQLAAESAKIPFMISHSPGCMFIGDLKDDDFKI